MRCHVVLLLGLVRLFCYDRSGQGIACLVHDGRPSEEGTPAVDVPTEHGGLHFAPQMAVFGRVRPLLAAHSSRGKVSEHPELFT